MKDYTGRLVAITGAANGMGAELARRFAASGADVALFDIDGKNLDTLRAELEAAGTAVWARQGDVADSTQVEAFADEVFSQFGRVDVLFNNAGVISAGLVWEEPLEDWDWLMSVNLKGLVNGVRAFVPRMSAQDFESDVVNTDSIASFLPVENSPVYVASKYAAFGMSQVLDLQLQTQKSPVRSHAVCPAIVQTDLARCNEHRNQPGFDPANYPYLTSDDYKRRWAVVEGSLPYGMAVDEAVTRIIDGVEANRFAIFTHPQYNPQIALGVQSLLDGIHPGLVQR